ncbi:hypothetical protein [Candidatus Nitrosotalea sp. TS]|uniref:hypothetical protein n=1 Tax=Candidatus Nitrosotalea sp. TS TaxID=2341020 RepID=UPI00140D2AE8|nr:hypothetical protein [Candidatus Nitrosotalea sp. TS]
MWINNNKDQAITIFNEQLGNLTGKTLPVGELDEAFSRMDITYDPVESSLYQSANAAYGLGFLGNQNARPVWNIRSNSSKSSVD